MISLPFRRPRQTPNIDALYGMIVAQARCPAFYRGYGVPDTVSGRLDMIMLHLVLVLRQLGQSPNEPQDGVPPVAQQLVDRFCRDMDDNFREMGVGDLSVPKEMQRVAEAYYGRARAYESALADNGAGALEAVVARNVFGLAEPSPGARRLAVYMRAASLKLGAQGPVLLARAEPDFSDPEATAVPSSLGGLDP